jgi:MYXO-CTERM domain-containing protein
MCACGGQAGGFGGGGGFAGGGAGSTFGAPAAPRVLGFDDDAPQSLPGVTVTAQRDKPIPWWLLILLLVLLALRRR